MNKTQQQYATSRVDGLLAKKEAALKTKFTKEAQVISPEERVALIRSGKVKLRSDVTQIHSYTDVSDVFDFSKYAWPRTLNADAFEKAFRPLADEAQSLKDTIMLGDSTEALAAIEKFAEKCEASA